MNDLLQSAKMNILLAVLAKLMSIGVVLFSVPILLQLLGTSGYGVWVSLTSLVAFISLLDLGVGNSLRNTVASSMPNVSKAAQLEFKGFFNLLGLIGLVASVAFFFASSFVDVFSKNALAANFLYLPLLIFLPLLLSRSVLQGAHATGVNELLQSLSSVLFFLVVWWLFKRQIHPKIESLSLYWSASYLFVLGLTFLVSLRILKISPSFLVRFNEFHLPKERLKIGISFLVLQITSLVIFNLGNFLILQNLGANQVARYDVLNRIFTMGLSFFSIVIGVMWSKISQYKGARDIKRLKRIFLILLGLSSFFSAGAFTVAFLAPWIIQVWTSSKVQISTSDSIPFAILVSTQAFAYTGAVFMNAFEKTGIQIASAAIALVLMIPLAHYFMGIGLGIVSVPVASAILTGTPLFLYLYYANRLIGGLK